MKSNANTHGMKSAAQQGPHNAHKGHKGHDHQAHHAHMAADFRRRFWISLVLTLPILVLSPLLQELAGSREVIGFAGDLAPP